MTKRTNDDVSDRNVKRNDPKNDSQDHHGQQNVPKPVDRRLRWAIGDLNTQDRHKIADLKNVPRQRLFRKLCPFCKKPVEVNAELLMANKVDPAPFEGVTVYGPGGCPKCRGSGYKGRGAFMEVLPISPKIRGLIERGGDAEKLKAYALEEGMVTLKEAGMRKVRAGVTSLEAAFEVTGGE